MSKITMLFFKKRCFGCIVILYIDIYDTYIVGNFHPYLDIYKKVFKLEARERMSAVSGAAILRFTEMELDFDESNVYISGTLLEKPGYLCM